MRWYVWAGIAVLALLSADAYFEYSGEGIWGLWANRKAPAAPVPAEALTSSSPLTGGPGQVAAQPGTGPGGLKTSSPSVSPHPGAIGSKKPNAGDRQPISKQPEIGVGPRAQAPQSKDSAALAPLEIKAKPTETQLPPASAHAPEDSSKATPGTELAGLIERALVSGAESKFREAAEVFRLPAEKLGQLDRFDRELARIHAEGYSGLADMKTLIIERLKSDPNKFDATMVLAKLPGGKLAGGDDRELRIKGPQVELPYLWSKLLLEDLHTLGSYVLSALPANGSLGLAVMSYDLNTDKDDAFARKVLAPLILPSPPRGEGGVRGARRLLELIDLRQELALAKKQAVQNAYAEKLLYELDLAMTQGDFAGVPAKAEQFRAKHADTEMIKARSEDLKTYVESAKLCKQLSVVTQPGNVALAGNGAVASGSPSARLLVDGNCTEYSSDAGFAFLTWPDKWIVTLPKVYLLREIRMLLWDVDAERFYRYQIETSYDGEHYTLHEDRSKGEWRTWQVLKFAPWPVKSIRITGTYCSANATFHVVELEAYCIPPDTPLPSRKPGLPAPALRPPPKVPPQPAPKKGAP